MYSGNHSVMHPLTTLLDAAVRLKEDGRFLFVHIGGGVRLQEVRELSLIHILVCFFGLFMPDVGICLHTSRSGHL